MSILSAHQAGTAGDDRIQDLERLIRDACAHLGRTHQLLSEVASLHFSSARGGEERALEAYRLKMRAYRLLAPAAAAARTTVPALDELIAELREVQREDPRDPFTLSLFGQESAGDAPVGALGRDAPSEPPSSG